MVTKIWILLFLAKASLGIQIYLSPALKVTPLSPTISPTQARVVVSHQLGLDAFDSLEEMDPSTERLVSGDFIGEGVKNALLLTVSEDVARDVVPTSFKPAFKLSNPPAAAHEMSLIVSSYLHRAQHTYSTVFSASNSPPQGALPRLIDVFTASPSDATEVFLAETAQIVSVIESAERDVFGAFQLTGVSAVAAEYGRASEQFQLAVDTTRALFQSAMANAEHLNLVILTYPGAHGKRQMQPPQSPLPPPGPQPQLPIGGVSTCHTSTEICTNVTNSCSGRGDCTQMSKAGKTCFVCQCEATLGSNGGRQTWVGDACERLDISAPFTLITGTVIGILVIIFGSVSLLYRVGDQQLPPTLTASASGHLKRD